MIIHRLFDIPMTFCDDSLLSTAVRYPDREGKEKMWCPSACLSDRDPLARLSQTGDR